MVASVEELEFEFARCAFRRSWWGLGRASPGLGRLANRLAKG